MTVYVYEDGSDVPDPGGITTLELLTQHKRRIVFRTSKGNIVMRYMPYGLKRTIDHMMAMLYPTAGSDAVALGVILDKEASGEKTEEDEIEADRLTSRLDRPSMLYALGVVESPRLSYEEDIYALMDGMTADEEAGFRELVTMLTSPGAPEDMDILHQTVAERYGVSLVDKELISNMTLQQAEYFAMRLKAERDAMDQMMGGEKRVVV